MQREFVRSFHRLFEAFVSSHSSFGQFRYARWLAWLTGAAFLLLRLLLLLLRLCFSPRPSGSSPRRTLRLPLLVVRLSIAAAAAVFGGASLQAGGRERGLHIWSSRAPRDVRS